MRIGTMVILMAVLGFCLIGFMSTFWQADATMRFVMRSMYGAVGLVCLVTMIWAVRPEKPEKKE
jgi:hypothetical protein